MRICLKCGICCYNTEMMLCREDINYITKSTNYKEHEFVIKEDKFLLLKNDHGKCFFLKIDENQNHYCKIYKNRPLGCRIYPLIYDIDEEKCIKDADCPYNDFFYQNKKKFKLSCVKLRKLIKIIFL